MRLGCAFKILKCRRAFAIEAAAVIEYHGLAAPFRLPVVFGMK